MEVNNDRVVRLSLFIVEEYNGLLEYNGVLGKGIVGKGIVGKGICDRGASGKGIGGRGAGGIGVKYED